MIWILLAVVALVLFTAPGLALLTSQLAEHGLVDRPDPHPVTPPREPRP